MLPRWHILWGLIFTLIIWFFAQNIAWYNLALIFLSSVLIDFDHYITATRKNKSLSLRKALIYHKNARDEFLKNRSQKTKSKEDFHLFHTVEFIVLMGLVGIYLTPFFFIFLGMMFHLLLDVIYMLNKKIFFAREFFFSGWIRKKIFK